MTFFAGLGRPAITDSDEAFYAESAREMLVRADWLTPHFNFTTRFEKPVLYYWMAAATYVVAGPSAWAARLPSALAGVGLVIIAYWCGRRWYDPPTARLAGVITATSFGAIAMARQALPDLPLTFFVTLAIWAALVGLLDVPAGGGEVRSRRAWLCLAAVAAAGAFLVKGPVGFALPAMVLLPITAVEWWLRGARWHVRATDVALAAALAVVVGAPWYVAMTAEHGVAYLDRFFLAENLDRFATARYNDPRPLWYYLPIVIGGLLPWSLFMPLWIPEALRAWRERTFDHRAVRLGLWALAPLAFYTVSIGKQPRYILPVLIPLAMLLADAIVRASAARSNRARLFGISAVGAGVTIVALGAFVYRAQRLLLEWSDVITSGVAVALMLAGAASISAAVGWLVTRRRRWGLAVPAGLAASSVVAALGAHIVVLATPGPAPVERMATMVAAARVHDEPYGRHRVFNRNLVYYVRSPHVELPVFEAVLDFLRSPERVLCVLRAEDVDRLARAGVDVRELGSLSYLNTGSFTLGMLLDPDPDRYLERVVLVTNHE